MYIYRVFKETIRSGGAKLTPKHIKDVSMCVLFLMEAAQKTDKTFGLSPQSTSHTVYSPHEDIDNMMKHLSEAKVTTVVEGRSTPSLTLQWNMVGRNCPQQAGSLTLCRGIWLTMRMI